MTEVAVTVPLLDFVPCTITVSPGCTAPTLATAVRAIFEFDDYRWMTLWLARYALVVLAASMLVRAAIWLLESGRSV